jgi:hypothetical protein
MSAVVSTTTGMDLLRRNHAQTRFVMFGASIMASLWFIDGGSRICSARFQREYVFQFAILSFIDVLLSSIIFIMGISVIHVIVFDIACLAVASSLSIAWSIMHCSVSDSHSDSVGG